MELSDLKQKTALLGRLMLISVLVCSLSACFQVGDDCSGGANCCEPKKIGDIRLDSASASWMPDESRLLFVNSNKYSSWFRISSQGVYRKGVNQNAKTADCRCGMDVCFDYLNAEQQRMKFDSEKLPLNFSYIRTANRSPVDSNLSYAVLDIHVNDIPFLLPMNRSQAKNVMLLDSIHLINKTYEQVYHVYTDSTRVDTSWIAPRGIYFHSTKGLVGFYLTNGETWELQ